MVLEGWTSSSSDKGAASRRACPCSSVSISACMHLIQIVGMQVHEDKITNITCNSVVLIHFHLQLQAFLQCIHSKRPDSRFLMKTGSHDRQLPLARSRPGMRVAHTMFEKLEARKMYRKEAHTFFLMNTRLIFTPSVVK